MATNLLWFVMAGFLLGFATSTLWEWFYFRKERLKVTDRRIRELEAKVRETETGSDSISPTESASPTSIPTVASVTGGATRTSAWGDTPYRSPGVFLESEELGADSSDDAPSRREPPRGTGDSAPKSPYVPTVNSVLPNAPNAASVSPAGASDTPAAAESALPPRVEQQSPADALRAKRSVGTRSRQEVLAELRRNSEAVRRGQPLPADDTSPPENVPPFAPRPDTLVRSQTPTEQPVVEAVADDHLLPAPADDPPNAEAPNFVPPVTRPSQVIVPVESAARRRWANDPELTERTSEYPDDLSKIKGIGPTYKLRLYQAGVYTWKQVAETDEETLRRAVGANQSSNIREWYGQAEKLMDQHGRTDAVYSGPHPDDMTKIRNIGPVSASVLYRAGICTYEQLASTSIEDLAALFPVAVAGDQPDFALWIARAEKLADEKHEDA